jgi:hypothetical protein
MTAADLPQITRFVARALEFQGGLVEAEGDALLALLPKDLAGSLGLDEQVRLEASGAGGGIPYGLGTPLLEALVEKGRSSTPFALAEREAALPNDAVLHALAEKLPLRNAVSRILKIERAQDPYLACAFAWTVEADERHEGVVLGVVHPGDGARPADDFLSGWAPEASRQASSGDFSLEQAPVWLSRLGRHLLVPTSASAVALTERRRVRDHGRIETYYAKLISEARHPRRKAEPAVIAAKVEHLLHERDQRLGDLEHRYAVRASARVAALLLLRSPVARITLEVRRRKMTRNLVFRVPAGVRGFDRLPCDACDGWAEEPLFCDDAMHVLCERCAPNAAGRPRCERCLGEKEGRGGSGPRHGI